MLLAGPSITLPHVIRPITLGFPRLHSTRWHPDRMQKQNLSPTLPHGQLQRKGKLLRQPGIIYDPVLNAVIAPDDVWESYIKVNKNAKRFRKKGCPFFNELAIIFEDTTVKYKDVYPWLPTQYSLDDEDRDKLDLEDASTNDTPSALPSNSSDGDGYPLTSMLRRRLRSPTPTSHFRAKRAREMEMRAGMIGEAWREWGEAAAAKARSPTVTPSMTTATTSKPEPETASHTSAFSITNCVKCLESIEGVDGGTYIKALKMFKDVDWREMFMAMSAERRLVWLASLE
ncbi:hypothetical protein Nepgr_012769 [Nepenthes gracilis]|uniref:Uncharacterized protein n=1 Tax=Nepenthes gracilis TaxID=150966 RepID=A0AAD3SGK2_NEPGR|nr:hypothetical protein Nepgr_012769 [Nepenthes gracilis]